ncbi:MAG: ATP-binding protein [Bacteroidota bacterium]
MRFLNKIVFINSATIRYADVLADGNVHLIGTQGVGKSTLLRAILYFYNADSLKLGISREKKSFSEYYFPFQNSFLIYEVMRETGPYCIIAFKSQGKVCFRFMDTGYDKKFFISKDGRAFEKWEETRQMLDELKIDYSRKIDRYEEYRDIVYGNSETGKKEFGKYALLQSRQYQNIPRTIQNVFLNSKLEAEFIKQTIIMSLNEEDISIDLQSYTHHLKDFEEQLDDIHKYKLPSVQKQAENVVKYHIAIRTLEKDKNITCRQLVWAASQVQRAIPKLGEKKERTEVEKQLLFAKIESSETRFRNKTEKIKGEISILDNDLKKAKERSEYYTGIQIAVILEKVEKKSSKESALHQLNKERELLMAKFADISFKYDALLLALENNLRSFEQQQNEILLQLKTQAMADREADRKWLDKVVAETRDNHKQNVLQARAAIEQQLENLQVERLKKEAIKQKRFYDEDRLAAQQLWFDYKNSIQDAEQQVLHAKNRMETLQKQWQLDETSAAQETERHLEKLQESVAKEQEIIASVTTKLQNSEDALYGWLNKNKPGWENSIGKICSEDILFNNELAPAKVQTESNALYGIDIKLESINVKVKTLVEYEAEKLQSEQKVANFHKQLGGLQSEKNEKLDKLRKKYQPLIKACKDEIVEQQYRHEQAIALLAQTELQLKDLEIKAASEKQQALQEVEDAIYTAQEMLQQRRQALVTAEDEITKLVKAREKEFDKKFSNIDGKLKAATFGIEKALEDNKQLYTSEKQQVKNRRQDELEGKGVDTKRVKAIEEQVDILSSELSYIEKMRDVVAVYKKEKTELIDRADENRNRKLLLDQQYALELEKQRLHKQALNVEIGELDNEIQQVKENLQRAEEDHKAFVQFQGTEAFQSTETTYKEIKDNYKTDKRCKVLIDDFNRNYYNAIKRLDDLKEAANSFLGNFSKQNIFNFKTVLNYKLEYQEFAEQLDEFVNNAKIDEFEKRINERFATIIHSLGKETGMLMSKGGEIQSVINNINKDFDNKNFVGAIKKIELRLDESANKVVNLLLSIKRFNDEHSYDIGGMNLFASADQTAKNKKAVDLLKQLGKAIGESKKEFIALSDSFELKFRVEENQNDTGWVEKLSNVGSEGTDVLVKAMINIMLLNVFKEGASKRFKDFRLHCMMDEIGKLHPNNVKGILQFANDRNILLINGSPTETNALDYRHIYKLEKDANRFTKIKRIITNYAQA